MSLPAGMREWGAPPSYDRQEEDLEPKGGTIETHFFDEEGYFDNDALAVYKLLHPSAEELNETAAQDRAAEEEADSRFGDLE